MKIVENELILDVYLKEEKLSEISENFPGENSSSNHIHLITHKRISLVVSFYPQNIHPPTLLLLKSVKILLSLLFEISKELHVFLFSGTRIVIVHGT